MQAIEHYEKNKKINNWITNSNSFITVNRKVSILSKVIAFFKKIK